MAEHNTHISVCNKCNDRFITRKGSATCPECAQKKAQPMTNETKPEQPEIKAGQVEKEDTEVFNGWCLIYKKRLIKDPVKESYHPIAFKLKDEAEQYAINVLGQKIKAVKMQFTVSWVIATNKPTVVEGEG